MKEGGGRQREGGREGGREGERERVDQVHVCVLDRNWKSGMKSTGYTSLHTYTCSPNSQRCCNVLLILPHSLTDKLAVLVVRMQSQLHSHLYI